MDAHNLVAVILAIFIVFYWLIIILLFQSNVWIRKKEGSSCTSSMAMVVSNAMKMYVLGF